MAKSSRVTLCSFCGKSQAEVKKIIAGPGVYICDSFVNVCKTIIDREIKPAAAADASRYAVTSLLRRNKTRLRRRGGSPRFRCRMNADRRVQRHQSPRQMLSLPMRVLHENG